jgi:uncharacterized protein (TIGR02246 family)
MRKILIALGLVVLCLAFPVRQGALRSDDILSAADDEQIRKAVDAYAHAFNKGDLDALTSVWATNAEYIDEKGALTKGRPAIAALFKKYLATLKGAKIAFKVTSIRPLTADVALQDGTSKLTRGDGSIDDGRFTAVWFKKDGKWMLRSVRDLPYEGRDAIGAGGALKELQWMVGNWKGDKEGVEVSVRWALNQAFLLQEYKVKQGDTHLEVKQLVGFDPLTGQIKSWTFDSLGGYGEGLWSREGNSWVINTVGVVPEGQTGSAINVIRHVDDQHVVFQAKSREVGGQPIADSEVKLVRKGSPK